MTRPPTRWAGTASLPSRNHQYAVYGWTSWASAHSLKLIADHYDVWV